MPSMQILGRRFNVSSDDVPIPAVIMALFHFGWAVLIAALRGFAFESLECSDAWPYVVYTVAIMACFLAATVLELIIAYVGSIGSLFEESKRRSVPTLIVIHLALSSCTVAVNLTGSWLLHSDGSICTGTPQEWVPTRGFAALVWTTWVVLFLFILFIITPLQIVPGTIQSDPRSWRLRCAILACICCRWKQMQQAPRGERRPLERLADLFHNIFCHADFTSSDVAATLYLAAMLQRLERRERISALFHSSSVRWHDEIAVKDPVYTSSQALAETDGAAERMLTPSHMARDLMPSQAPESIIRLYCKPGRPVAASELSTAAEFAPYAMAAYGSLFYVYASRNRTSACCQLCLRACCSCCMSDVAAGKVSVFEQDINLPKFDPSRVMTKAAVCEIANINERDLKHVESSNSFNKQAPYFIALNRDSRTVVVSIRGTFSWDDTMTDLMCHPQDYPEWVEALTASLRGASAVSNSSSGPALPHFPACPAIPMSAGSCHCDGAGHSGIMHLAGTLVRSLLLQDNLAGMLAGDVDPDPNGSTQSIRSKILHWLPSPSRDLGKRPLLEASDSEPESVNSSVPPSPHDGAGGSGRQSATGTASTGAPSPSGPWRLVITGHSLGAGIAAFAGLFLHTLYPGVRVFCYSPPAWLMTPELAKYAERFVTSVVINKDLFSRLTLRSVEQLRDELVNAGARCRLNKPQVVLSSVAHAMTYLACCRRGRTWESIEAMFDSTSEATEGAVDFLLSYRQSVARHMSDSEFETLKTFRPPGRILFLRSLKLQRKQSLMERRFSPLWIDPADLAQEGLILSRHMLLDHFPDRALSIIKKTVADMAENTRAYGEIHGEYNRTYSAPAIQSVSYSKHRAAYVGRAAQIGDDAPVGPICIGGLGRGESGCLPPRSQTTPAVLDTDVSVGVGPVASARARKPTAALQVSTSGIEVDIAMSSTSAMSRVSSSGALGGL